MTENLTLDLATVIDALTAAFNTESPGTKAAARKLAGTLTAPAAALVDWMTELGELIEQLEAAGGDLGDADADDRDGMHTAWIEAVDQLADHLRAAVRTPASA